MAYQLLPASSPVVAEEVLAGTLPSWNPHVTIRAVPATIEMINGPAVLPNGLGVPTGGGLQTGWRYPTNYNGLATYPTNGYSEKRMFIPPAVVNGFPTFVEIHRVAVGSQLTEDYSVCYNPFNYPGTTCNPNTGDYLPSGRGFPANPEYSPSNPNGPPGINYWGDTTESIYNPSIGDLPGIHRMHVEIDRNWSAQAQDTADPTWDALNGHVQFRNLIGGTLIDLQGYVYWDPEHTTEQWHNFSGFEIHPITAWRLAQ